MKNKGLLLLLACIWSLTLKAAPTHNKRPSWIVTPNICITPVIGEPCEMEIRIEVSDVPEGDYCLWIDELSLGCVVLPREDYLVSLSYSNDALLQLLDERGQMILQQQLVAKGRKALKTRRRVRQPWSLF